MAHGPKGMTRFAVDLGGVTRYVFAFDLKGAKRSAYDKYGPFAKVKKGKKKS